MLVIQEIEGVGVERLCSQQGRGNKFGDHYTLTGSGFSALDTEKALLVSSSEQAATNLEQPVIK